MRNTVGASASSRFLVVRSLGSGGFGAVYEAIDTRSNQRVALKVLDDLSAASIARFKQEFRALSDCHHPNLVDLKELIEEEGRWTIVMELVPGADFLTYVRGDVANDNQPYDLTRLRTGLLGIARGLSALHGFGALHRDLKPSNVLVTTEGRAVLLDFGLVTSIDPSRQSTHMGLLGTVAYMAPEQAVRANLGPPADWYALGVCLFEALTGRQPFPGATVFQVMNDKQAAPAARASSLNPAVPPELDELCARLLEREPEQRAGAREVFAVLASTPELELEPGVNAPTQVPFSGREAEMRQLERALSRAEQGSLRFVLVEGESGVGKSELVSELVRRTRVRLPDLLTLQSRCYENEQVAYKAFDGGADDLARFLTHLPERAAALLLPPRATLLGQLFPTLRTVRAIERAPESEPSADPTARRLEAFGALAALLHKLASERTVVLVIDDLQWADPESFRLLLALMEHPEPPPILIVATIRPPEELDPEVSAGLDSLRRKAPIDVVPILGLPPREAADLAQRLLGPGTSAEYCQLIASESGGHPLFLSELVHFVQSHDFSARGALSLEAALRARVEQLEPKARALLEIVALAGRPYGSHVFASALAADDLEESARSLLATKLLRRRRQQELGCYHDRIRHTAVAMIAKSRVPGLHRRLAEALAADPQSDAFEQAQHWDLAGEREQAIEAYARAASSAFAALAFIRAADLAARAMRLLEDDGSPRSHKLLVLRAHALACAGRSGEAAALYERSARGERGNARLQLRGKYVQQLMLSGRLDEAIVAMRDVLAELGVDLPRTSLGTFVRIIVDRLWLRFGNKRFKTRAPRPGEEDQVLAGELISTFTHALSPIHPALMMLLTLRSARLAQHMPLPSIVLQLYSAIGWMRMLSGSVEAAETMFDRAHRLAPEIDSPAPRANALMAEGSARLVNWQMRSATRCLEEAHHILQTRCPDRPGQLRNVRYHLGLAWFGMAEYGRIASETERWIGEARERNDPLAIILIAGMGQGFLRHLMRDDPEAALREIDTTLRELPAEPFSFVHFGAMIARMTTLFYQGGPAGYEWLEAHVESKRLPMLLRSEMGRRTVHMLRYQSALHALEGASPKQREVLLGQVRASAKFLLRSRFALVRAYGHMALAQVHAVTGQPERALFEARAARAASTEQGESNGGYIARYLEVSLESKDREDPRRLAVLSHLAAQGFREPLAFLHTMLPALKPANAHTRAREALRDKLVLGRYDVVQTLGGGGFGSVVEVRDVQTGRMLALKELVSKHPRSLERFKQEFRELRDLHHANVARLEALLEHDRSWYIVMELLHGDSLTAYCRPDDVLDRARLRSAFDGVCAGLSVLHDAGFAHRDVTPANVCVTAEGRAVLLDFGLIGRIGDEHDGGAVGNVEYAAPEQLAGAPPSVAADVYALGTCLYQALSGELPFRGANAAQVLQRKRTSAAEPLDRAEGDGVAALALEMLARDPAARPTLASVRARLLGASGSPTVSSAPPIVEQTGPFAGREDELARLNAAFERTCDDGLLVSLIEGESGLGKSALMAEFARQTESRVPNGLLLRSRCYESEQIAYKAFDGAIDQLARALRELPAPTCEALMPRQVALLAQLFPVLASVPAIAAASTRGLPVDPSVRQRAAMSCFVELLARLTEVYEVLFLIDDLQWADSESFRLLSALYEQRTSLPLLIVCTVRPGPELSPEVADALSTLTARTGSEVITLGGLSEAAATRLVLALRPEGPDQPHVARFLHEAKGHPLFLRELVEQERAGTGTPGTLSLDEALRARIERFDANARTLLSLVALAGKPHGTHVLARALQMPNVPREALVALLAGGLLRRSGSDGLSVYHDRIARAALDLLPPERTRSLAAALAAALALEPGAEASDRARLWEAAGDAARASEAYGEAGHRALEGLQFAGAAQHYARALELLGDANDARRRELLERRGMALARAGRSAQAAHAFQAAAERAEGDVAVRLRIAAAEQAIQGAQPEWGLSAARALLVELGLPVATSPRRNMLRAVWNRAVVRMQPERSPTSGSVSPRRRMQLEAAWSLAFPLSWLDPLAGAALTTQHMRLALAAGEPTHLARALASDAVTHAITTGRSPRKIDALLAQARQLAQSHGDPALEAEVEYRAGLTATYRWTLPTAKERLEHALVMLTERCPDQPWLTSHVCMALGAVWFNVGEHALLADKTTGWLAEARDRGDEFGKTTLQTLGYGFIDSLMRDDTDALLARFAVQRALWPEHPYSFMHFGDMLAMGYTLLYRGHGEPLAWFERSIAQIEHGVLVRRGTGRAIYLCLHVAALLEGLDDVTSARGRELIATARRRTAELSRVAGGLAAQLTPLMEAQIEALTGKRERALEIARRLAVVANQSGFLEQAARADYLAATLEGGASGKETRTRLLARAAEQGWVKPERRFALLCPIVTKQT